MAHRTGASPQGERPYAPTDTLGYTGRTAVMGLAGGIFGASLQNALAKRNVGAFGIFTRGAPIIGIMTVAPAAGVFVTHSMMNLREKEDSWAFAVGGFVSGAIIGMPFKSMPAVLGFGAFVGVLNGVRHFTGGRINSFKEEGDEFERKEILRRTTRVPLEQTISEIGEGRGIRPPGYEERRRERIKEKYGFEIDPVKVTVDGSQ